ncbi:CbrC family protein [Streptomyces viridiviolaceus]
MGSSIYVYRFRDGDIVPMEGALVREVLEPYAPYEAPGEEHVAWVRAADGSEADVSVDHGVSFARPGSGVLDIVAELARRTGAAVLPGVEGAIVTSESDRQHLPQALRESAFVVPPPALTGQAIGLVIRPRPEPRTRPVLPPFPYLPDPVASGAVVAADERCACCGHDQGWLCTVPSLGRDGQDVPEGRLCPYCVAFGTAARRHGLYFNEVLPDQVPGAVAARIRERTPGLPGRGRRPWPAHCGDGALFVGTVTDDGRTADRSFRCRSCGNPVADTVRG